MFHDVRIIEKIWLTHDVIRIRLEKPGTFYYLAGQAIEATIDNPRFKEDLAPFTLTSLNTDNFLELILKVYSERKGMTLELSLLKTGDTIIISDPWDSYKNMGPGVFIAGGTGITPFIAILRQLKVEGRIAGCQLFFSNKTEKDIFLFDELSGILGNGFINILTREKKENFIYGRIDKEFLNDHIIEYKRPFYICGPDNFPDQIRDQLIELGIEKDLINLSF